MFIEFIISIQVIPIGLFSLHTLMIKKKSFTFYIQLILKYICFKEFQIINKSIRKKCNILPAAHAITRCDSTSSLFGIGKRTVFKVLKDSPENFRDLSTLADCDTDQPTDAASKLVCRLYDQKGKLKEDHVDLSKLGVRLATLRDACLAKLPPCEDTFTQHVLRSLLQINIWMTAYVAKPPMKSAVLLGWEDRNGLVPVYFKGQMSSDFLQDLKLFVLAKENLCA